MVKKANIALLLILTLGFLIRIYRISAFPLYGDELTMVYDSYSILKTGMDQTGEKLPLTFAMGAGRPGGYIYFSLPFVAIFGPTALGVRGLSVASGIGIIALVYVLAKKVLGEKAATFASLLTAVSPWEIYLSRAGFEAHFGLFLALLGIISFLFASGKKWLYLVWAISWGLAIHTYPTFKLTLPVVFLLLLWFSYHSKKEIVKAITQKFFVIALILLSIFGLLAIKETLKGRSEERFSNINIFANETLRENLIQKINRDREVSSLPKSLHPIFYNKGIEYGRLLIESYLSNFSSDFLFLRGDRNPRHNPGEFGMLYLVELPLIAIALVLLWNEKRKTLIFLGLWIVITPLATMFLGETHGLRNALMLPALLVLSGFALSKLSKSLLMVSMSLIVLELLMVLQQIYFVAPGKLSNFWALPAKEAVELALDKRDEYDLILISDRIDNIEYAYPVYARVDPSKVISQYNRYPKVYDNVQIINLDSAKNKNGQVFVIE